MMLGMRNKTNNHPAETKEKINHKRRKEHKRRTSSN
jgi:hypothetical protein